MSMTKARELEVSNYCHEQWINKLFCEIENSKRRLWRSVKGEIKQLLAPGGK